MANEKNSYILNIPTISALNVMRKYYFYPVFLKHVSGNIYRVSNPLNVLSAIRLLFFPSLRILNICLFINIICDDSYSTVARISNKISLAIIITHISFSLLIFIVSLMTSTKQFIHLINFLDEIQKIAPSKYYAIYLGKALRRVKIYFICFTILLITISTVDITLSYDNYSVKYVIFLITLHFNDVSIIMAGMHNIFFIVILRCCIKSLYRSVLLRNIYEDKRHLQERTVMRFVGSYLTLCEMVRVMNKTQSTLLLLIFIIENVYNFCNIYYLTSAFQLQDASTRMTQILIQSSWLFYMSLRLFLRIENCHRLNEEISNINNIICKIYKLSNDRDRLGGVHLVFEQMSLCQIHFAPLDIFTFNRSLIVSIISAMTSSLLIILQFNLKDLHL